MAQSFISKLSVISFKDLSLEHPLSVVRTNSYALTFFWSPIRFRIVSFLELIELFARGDPSALTYTVILDFQPNQYYHVYQYTGQDMIEISPSSNLNLWIRFQHCLGCRFRIQGKKPVVIKEHFATCRLRNENDPLKKLCQLLLAR
jgi:hypothetical protein